MKKKILVTLSVIACALLLVVGSVVGTFAYLTSNATVTNTFTVGNVAITMDETDVDNSTPDKDRDTVNSYKLMPGHTYTKDPEIHVDPASEDCWLFVKLSDGLESIQAEDTVEQQLIKNGWSCIDEANNIWAHENVASANDDVKVFDYIKVKGDVNSEDLAAYNNAKVSVVAYAIQADGFTSAEAAWNAAKTAGDIA
ncbi:MAG: hypothetical protein IJY50_08435 [Clostridia bacterium]|nr:hypothetical protein [Clostridia bacterium]